MEVFSVEVFGERMRTRRRERGLTQMALAQQMGVSQGWLSEIENARQGAVQADTLYRLCVTLDCSADYLLGLADTPGRATPPRPRRTRPAPAADAPASGAFCAECGVGDGCHLIDCSVGLARIANDPKAAAALERGRRLTEKLRELAGQAAAGEGG